VKFVTWNFLTGLDFALKVRSSTRLNTIVDKVRMRAGARARPALSRAPGSGHAPSAAARPLRPDAANARARSWQIKDRYGGSISDVILYRCDGTALRLARLCTPVHAVKRMRAHTKTQARGASAEHAARSRENAG
jgi:hypothetical protein